MDQVTLRRWKKSDHSSTTHAVRGVRMILYVGLRVRAGVELSTALSRLSVCDDHFGFASFKCLSENARKKIRRRRIRGSRCCRSHPRRGGSRGKLPPDFHEGPLTCGSRDAVADRIVLAIVGAAYIRRMPIASRDIPVFRQFDMARAEFYCRLFVLTLITGSDTDNIVALAIATFSTASTSITLCFHIPRTSLPL